MDICSLFGNALDNAITSTEKIENPEKRLIHVMVSREKGFLRIKIENSFQGELKMKNQLPVTTKEDRRYHGFGVKSMKEIGRKITKVSDRISKGWLVRASYSDSNTGKHG